MSREAPSRLSAPSPSRTVFVPRFIEVVSERLATPVAIAVGLIIAVGSFTILLLLDRRRRRREARALEESSRDEYQTLTASLVGNLSHELYTPLTPVKGYASMLQRRTLSEDQVRLVAGEMVGASQRLEHLFDMLVALADIQRGRYDTRAGVVDLPALMRDVTKRIPRDRRSAIEVSIERGLPDVRADGRLLELGVAALVDNALKFSRRDEVVRIDVRAVRASEILQITVRDRGSGMTAEQLRVAFDPFRQVDGTLAREFGGLGVGLALADRVARAHGGRIIASSRLGKGSTFTISMPLIPGARAVPVTPWAAERAA